MARLSLSLLGSFQADLDGQPVTGFKSNKERALLAYLAVEAGRPHRREAVAGMLWPEWPDREALGNLRYALSNLRQTIGDRTADPPFLLITRDTLQFNPGADYGLDVAALEEAVAARLGDGEALGRLERAVELYRGAFLEGFSVSEGAGFEEWALLTRERLARLVLTGLQRLAEACEQRGEYEAAEAWARRQLALEPWDEGAHRGLMRVLALGGRRSAALAQYEACRRVLAAELGVEPDEATVRLYEQVRDGRLRPAAAVVGDLPEAPGGLPAFLEAPVREADAGPFVARERELGRLNGLLERALAGQGGVVFVTGEAGSGKTALLQGFARQAQEAHGNLVVASGNCNAYSGIGDPYLPFREILHLLTGDIEAPWRAGAMSRERARRLWRVSPVALQALVEAGPDLLDTFVSRSALRERALAQCGAGWRRSLEELLERKPAAAPGALSLQQSDLFEQYTRVLKAVAKQAPLLLVLDDLQWADLGSIGLLFHLGRRLAGSRLFVLGAYRPEELAQGRDGARHPLEPVVNELQRDYGPIAVSLDEAESRAFVEAILDSEPNRLGAGFREMLYRQTGGNPLFTIELLRGLQARGDLLRDAEGCWIEGETLDWESLPARVEAVVAERIGRLPRPLQAALRAASVEGEIFTAEVVARLRGTDEREMLERLSDDLDREHRLVRAQSLQRVAGQSLSCYRFRHILFQRYLYGSLDHVERAHLHEQVATTLEGLYGGEAHADPIAVQLALHYQRARVTEKAVRYLLRAGERAVQMSAYQEAIAHATRGLALLETLPDSPERAELELGLQVALGEASLGPVGYRSPETKAVFARAADLSRELGKTAQWSQVAGHLATWYYVAAEYRRAREFAEEALGAGERLQDPLLVMAGHWRLGFVLFGLGEYAQARAHLGQVIAAHDLQRDHRLRAGLHGADPGASVLAYDACCLWCLGYPEQALRRGQEALALARALGHPFTLADVLSFAGCHLHSMCRDAPALRDYVEQLAQLATREGLAGWKTTTLHGEALAMMGQLQEGIALMREGVADDMDRGIRLYVCGRLCHLAEALGRAGAAAEGLAEVTHALAVVEETGEHHWEAELHRVKGRLLLLQGSAEEAEAAFAEAITVARRQQAKSWELRATMDLCRLWQAQGKADQARQVLAEIYNWFTEGFDTEDLRAARRLLEA